MAVIHKNVTAILMLLLMATSVHAKSYPLKAGQSFSLGAHVGIENDKLVVKDIVPGSEAERRGLQPGDIVLSMNRKDDFLDIAHFIRVMQTMAGEQFGCVLLKIQRGDTVFLLMVTLDLVQEINGQSTRTPFPHANDIARFCVQAACIMFLGPPGPRTPVIHGTADLPQRARELKQWAEEFDTVDLKSVPKDLRDPFIRMKTTLRMTANTFAVGNNWSERRFKLLVDDHVRRFGDAVSEMMQMVSIYEEDEKQGD